MPIISSRRRTRKAAMAAAGLAATAANCSGGTGPMPSVVVDAFVPLRKAHPSTLPNSNAGSSSSLVGKRGRSRTVPLVLKDPTKIEAPPRPAVLDKSSKMPPAGPVSSSVDYAPLEQVNLTTDEMLNRDFTNDLILGAGFATAVSDMDILDVSSGSSAAAVTMENDSKIISELEETAQVPLVDETQILIESQIESISRNGIDTVVPIRVDGIPVAPLEQEQQEDPTLSSLSTTTGTAKSSTYKVPSLMQIAKFALPATAIYLCDPLLSLIDTASVGLLAGTNHQAALSPAIAVVNYSGLLLAFLFVGATNFVAQAAAKTPDRSSLINDDATEHESSPAKILLSTLQISMHTGTILGMALFALAPTLITLLSGRSTPLPTEIFNPAVTYVRIRALGFPAAAVLGSAQAACLGLKDTSTPLLVLAAAAVLNVLGDLCLVGCTKTPWLYGAAGAAWATTIGQFAAVALFLRLLKAKPKAAAAVEDDTSSTSGSPIKSSGRLSLTRLFARRGKKTDVRAAAASSASLLEQDKVETAPESILDNDDDGATSARGFLAEHNFKARHIVQFPTKKTVKQYLPYVVPVTTTSVGRVSLFLSMAHVVSSCMGVVGMAAQTIALGIFDALCPLSQSLTLAAQAFVPGALEEQDRLKKEKAIDGKKKKDILSIFSRQFLKAGAAFGLFTMALSASIPLMSGLMTNNAAVVAQIKAVCPQLAAIFAMHGLVMSAEGILLGKEDVNFLGWMYGAFFFIMPALMMRVKHGALHLGKAAGLDSIWGVFMGYQFVRMLLWSGRAAMPSKDV